MDSKITMASAMLGEGYRATGRTVQRVGLHDLSLEEIRLSAIGAGQSADDDSQRAPQQEGGVPHP